MIAVSYDNAIGAGDLGGYADNRMLLDKGLETAVAISLFSNRRALEGDLDLTPQFRNGWWGDSYSDIVGDQLGSRLWTLAGRKTTDDNLRRAEELAKEALQWMIDDSVAEKIEAVAERVAIHRARMRIRIYKPGDPSSPWERVWDVTFDGDLT